MLLSRQGLVPGSTWHKSSRSAANGHCVEIAREPEAVAVRDSKDVAGPVLRFTDADWTTFLAGVRTGEFDRPGS